MSAARRLAAVVAPLVAPPPVVLVPVTGPSPAGAVRASDGSQFRAGTIITDQLFFDGSAMTAAQVQRFLEVRNPDCVRGPDGSPCLKHYKQSTWTRAADAQCPGTYTGATGETAAAIIAKVGRACGISQRVLLVILQKEQGLVTASGSGLHADRYRKAMGYACPDTAPCDARYYGFFNQVYSAAYRYRFYAANPTRYNHRSGQVNEVRYHPDPACGSSAVRISNQATAGLYNYTPYQPNQAALDAGAGTGDRCSAYGNRNFWRYFTNWFGSTQTPGAGDLADLYVATGAERGPLGAVRTPVDCGLIADGCRQGYERGSIYWSASTGARAMLGPIQTLWKSGGAETGLLGYPTRSVSTLPGEEGQFATFQGGSIWWTPGTGARALLGEIERFWRTTGAQDGLLGFPTRSVTNLPDGVGQYATFQGGSIWWSPGTGARAMLGEIEKLWKSSGAQSGPLGYPTGSVSTLPGGAGQYATFQGGSVYWTPETGTRAVLGAMNALWQDTGAQAGPLGYPTWSSSWLADREGQYATFQNGSIWWHPETGAGALLGPIEDAWRGAGAETGPLGYPTSSVSTAADGTATYAHFETGSLWAEGSTLLELGREVRDAWIAAGADRGRLGGPTASETAADDGRGRIATFDGGSIHWSPETGAHGIWNPVRARWTAEGGTTGTLGYPVDRPRATADGRADVGRFEGGSVYAGPSTGAHVLRGRVAAFYEEIGAERSLLGLPTADVVATQDGRGEMAGFEGGSLWWTPQTGSRAVLGQIERLWVSGGAERGVLGYPTKSVTWLPGKVGQYATFEHGSIWWTPETGARALLGDIEQLWKASGGIDGVLGLPTGSVSSLPGGGQYATFEGGSIWWSAGTGARALLGPVESLWRASGALDGPLGFPTWSVSWLPGRVGQHATFEGGSIWWSQATGARVLLGEVERRWDATGRHSGSLGFPTRSVTWSTDRVGQFALFQRGGIWWKPATGAQVLTGSFLTTYRGAGAEQGRLGYPTGEAYAVNGGTWQNFEGGTIRRSTATGRTWVQLR